MSSFNWPKTGTAYILCAIMFFTLMGISVKLLPNIPFYEVIFFRGIISATFCILTVKHLGLPLLGQRQNRPLLIARGVVGTIGLGCYFFCIKSLNFAYAMTIQQTAPIFSILLAFIIWRKTLEYGQLLAGIICVMGVFWIYKANIDVLDWYITIGLMGAFFSSLAYEFVHQLKGRENPSIVILYFPLACIPLSGIFLLYHWVTPTLHEWLILLWIGISTHLAQLCLTHAFQLEHPSKIAVYTNLNIVLACLASYFIFDEYLNQNQVLGLLVIIVGLLTSTWFRRQEQKLVSAR